MQTVPAVRQALSVLQFLGSRPAPVRALAIINELQLPRSTCYQLLATLVEAGFVSHYLEDQTYGLGFGVYELSAGYPRQAPLQRMARVPMGALKERTGNSAHLGVLQGREVLYVLEERAPRRPALVTDVGVRLPAHITASGRALLAAMSQAQVRALYPDRSPFDHPYPVGPRSPSELRGLLQEVRRKGFASEDGEVTPGLCSIATAVVDHTGFPLASIAVTFPQSEQSPELHRTILRELNATARELSRRVGGSPGLVRNGNSVDDD